MLQGTPPEILFAVFRTASGLPPDIEWVVAVWLLMIGGCFGSLMNVIVYRWPAGMSIVMPGSRCPRCLHPIRLYDNIPVVSWIVLGARCRDCRAPIPVRYPLVEAAVAVLFFAFFVIEVIHGGANLPYVRGIDSIIRSPRRPEILWGIYGLHMLLGYVLICAALITLDGNKPPAKLIWPPLLITAVATTVCPELWPSSAMYFLYSPWLVSAIGALTSAVAGGIGGRLLDAASGASQRGDGSLSATWLGALVGVVVGWFAVIVICLATGVFLLLSQVERSLRPEVRGLPASVYLTFATLLFILYWRHFG